MLRGVWLAALLGSACDSSTTPAREREAGPELSPAVERRDPETKSADSGPRRLADDPSIKPYVAKPAEPLDFSEVDVSDAPMDDAADSMSALGRGLVDALNTEDRAALQRLALTESEYKERFFEVLIHHRNALKMGASLAWSELSGESKGDLSTALQRYGGRGYRFVRVDVKQVDERPKVRLHRSPRIVVANTDGEESELVMVGSVVEHIPSGGFKVLAFRDTP